MPLVLDGTTGFNLPTGANVGIGTTNPDEQLHVHESSSSTEIKVSSGNGYATAQLDAAASAGAGVRFYHGGVQRARIETRPSGTQLDFIMGTTGSGRKLTLDADGNIALNWTDNKTLEMYYDNSYHMGLMFDAASRDILIRNKAGDSAGDIRFQTDNGTGTLSTKMVILANGYVGIGATSAYSASTDFEVKAADPKIVINNTGQRAYGLLVSGTNLYIRDESDNQNIVTITEGGRVGIGTVSPDAPLHIEDSTSSAYGGIRVVGAGTGSGSTNVREIADFGRTNSGSDSGVWLGGRTDETTAVIGAKTASGNIAFEVYQSGWKERMRIKNNGNVGIGTTNPLTKLHAQVSNVSGYTSVQNDGIVIERTGGTAALNIATDIDQTGAIWFGDATDADAGGIFYQHNADRMIFRVAAGSRVKINSQGVIEGASDAEIKTSPIRKHSNTISTNTTIDSSENAIASGPISIATGVTLTINGNMTVV